MLERQGRARKLETVEGIPAVLADALDARGGQRIVGHGKRQAIDHHQRERLARHVHALPETLCGQQHRADLLAECGEQHVARAFTLYQQRKTTVGAQTLLGHAQVAEAGKEQKRPTAREPT